MNLPNNAEAFTASGRTLFIAGDWTGATETYARTDPAHPENVTGHFASATPSDVQRAYKTAAESQKTWRAMPAPRRADVLRHAADILEERTEQATNRLVQDIGKARVDARAEVQRSAAICRYFAGELLQPSGETFPSADPRTLLMTIERPVGVVCAITPWNFPFAIPTWKLAPALGFGNAVIWKPAAAASGSAVFLTHALQDAGLPGGVLNLITGGGRSLSSALTEANELAAISFTGSGSVGQQLRAAVADRNVKVQLELGGKNPAVVLADADLEATASAVARGAMAATGQRCTATSRVYVERPVMDEFCSLLVDRVESLTVGDPSDEDTDVGPLASSDQFATVSDYLAQAQRDGATFLCGGPTPSADRSFFVRPTVLRDVPADSDVLTHEIFGPVLIVQEVADFEAALAAANSTEFGLSSAVFTNDLTKTMAFIEHTESGVVHVNRETGGVEPHVPFGGIKASSSMHREQGKAARAFFTTSKTVYLKTPDAPTK